MKLDPRATLITVEVEIFKGAKSRIVRMALDTGATYLMIPWHVAEALDYSPAKARESIRITTASGTETAPLLTLHKVKVLAKGVGEGPRDLSRPSAAKPGGRAVGTFLSEVVRC